MNMILFCVNIFAQKTKLSHKNLKLEIQNLIFMLKNLKNGNYIITLICAYFENI